MTDPELLKHHAGLFLGTAKRLGLDIEQEVLAGHLPFDGIADAVLRCTRCANPEDCAHWLERDEPLADAPPVYCQNRDLLTDLARGAT